MEIVERGWDDFWAEIFRVKHRRSIPGINEYDEMIVDFCIETLGLSPGDELLDVACGAGDQSILFAKKGINVSAFDISERLINTATERAKSEGLEVNFFTGDMREVEFPRRFKGIVILSHSFGFFNHEENQHVLKRSYESLVDGGRLLLDLMNPYNLPRFQKTWTKLDRGYLLSEPHVIDATAGMLRGRPATFIDVEAGRIVLANEDALSNNDIRLYTALEIRNMLQTAGFKSVDFYGQNKLPRMPYTATSGRMVVVATK